MNEIKTAGYLIKRLRDAGFVVWKIFNCYDVDDVRKWTILVDPGKTSVYITCYQNKPMIDGVCFQLHDGGQKFPENMFLKTQSAEVIIQALLDANISDDPTTNKFFKHDEFNN